MLGPMLGGACWDPMLGGAQRYGDPALPVGLLEDPCCPHPPSHPRMRLGKSPRMESWHGVLAWSPSMSPSIPKTSPSYYSQYRYSNC